MTSQRYDSKDVTITIDGQRLEGSVVIGTRPEVPSIQVDGLQPGDFIRKEMVYRTKRVPDDRSCLCDPSQDPLVCPYCSKAKPGPVHLLPLAEVACVTVRSDWQDNVAVLLDAMLECGLMRGMQTKRRSGKKCRERAQRCLMKNAFEWARATSGFDGRNALQRFADYHAASWRNLTQNIENRSVHTANGEYLDRIAESMGLRRMEQPLNEFESDDALRSRLMSALTL